MESDTDGAGIKIVLKNKKKRTLLSDLGYGITQILNIMLKTALIGIKGNFLEFSYPKFITPKILYLEEPECNLHPNLQSKLSDFFIQASKVFNIQFIIETHSEYLVRKLQYLTAKEKIKPEDTAIYYFSASTKKNDDQGLVKRIHIYSDGSLSDNFGKRVL
ncbi:MAG: AAA family ATPase [Bacteroidota bacterium]|nr:AAA family ATPase [Bacteroidota bacterium]